MCGEELSADGTLHHLQSNTRSYLETCRYLIWGMESKTGCHMASRKHSSASVLVVTTFWARDPLRPTVGSSEVRWELPEQVPSAQTCVLSECDQCREHRGLAAT